MIVIDNKYEIGDIVYLKRTRSNLLGSLRLFKYLKLASCCINLDAELTNLAITILR